MLSGIKTYFVNFWDETKHYLKVNLLAILVITFVFALIAIWLLPEENKTRNVVSQKYELLAQQFDTTTFGYHDPQQANDIKNEVGNLENNKEITKIIKTILVSTILVSLVGILAAWLQFIFTDLPFTKMIFGNVTDSKPMIVLAAALISATIIVATVFIVVSITLSTLG